MPEKFHFKCVDCNAEYAGDKVIYLCPACETLNRPGFPPLGVLKTVYNYETIRSGSRVNNLFERMEGEHFLPLLPIKNRDAWPDLRVGNTPMYRLDGWTGGRADGRTGGQADKRTGGQADGRTGAQADGKILDDFEVFLKDDSQNPTYSFKDRASALVSAWAREHGIHTLAAASTGNAGSSLAGICASQGQHAIIVVPAAAPLAKLTQILMYGASLIPVRGTYDDAFDLSVEISKQYGFYNRNTAYNPLTIEGKKTVSFEIFGQLNQQVPDRIFIPVGDGVIFSGVCKGFEDLLLLGIIDRMPVLVAVQAAGSSNLINNLKKKSFVAAPSNTIADSISVDVPRCFHMTAGYLDKYYGESVLVSDEEILAASLQLSRSTGLFSEPAAVAAYAGMLKYRDQGLIPSGSKNVVLLTGSGLKDLSAVQSSIQIPDPIDPEIKFVEKLFGNNSRPAIFPEEQ
ncbi:MAG: pyridoxal-phosphate dependent enzyme [Bacteroidetes bacterium]|nr:pyridoxal-phosphate dependent enzyme [Bacteroidota bacterium]